MVVRKYGKGFLSHGAMLFRFWKLKLASQKIEQLAHVFSVPMVTVVSQNQKSVLVKNVPVTYSRRSKRKIESSRIALFALKMFGPVLKDVLSKVF